MLVLSSNVGYEFTTPTIPTDIKKTQISSHHEPFVEENAQACLIFSVELGKYMAFNTLQQEI